MLHCITNLPRLKHQQNFTGCVTGSAVTDSAGPACCGLLKTVTTDESFASKLRSPGRWRCALKLYSMDPFPSFCDGGPMAPTLAPNFQRVKTATFEEYGHRGKYRRKFLSQTCLFWCSCFWCGYIPESPQVSMFFLGPLLVFFLSFFGKSCNNLAFGRARCSQIIRRALPQWTPWYHKVV